MHVRVIYVRRHLSQTLKKSPGDDGSGIPLNQSQHSTTTLLKPACSTGQYINCLKKKDDWILSDIIQGQNYLGVGEGVIGWCDGPG